MSDDRNESGTSGSGESVIDDLRAAWEHHESGGEGGSGDSGEESRGGLAPSAAKSDSSISVDKTGEKDENKDTAESRPRNPDGTFAAKADQTDQTEKDGKAADQTAKPKAEPEKPAAATQAAAPKPGNWSDISDDDWSKVPSSVQTKLHAREAQFANWYNGVNQHIAPLVASSRARNLSWQEGLGLLLNAQKRLDEDPYGAMLWLAKGRGINLDDL